MKNTKNTVVPLLFCRWFRNVLHTTKMKGTSIADCEIKTYVKECSYSLNSEAINFEPWIQNLRSNAPSLK